MKKTSFIFIGVLFMLAASCSQTKKLAFKPGDKIAPAILQNDLRILKQVLEANHPSLYWYTPKDSIDHYFATTIESINDSLNELQFHNKVAWVVDKIHCGHTQVRFSKGYTKFYTGKRNPQFPLLMRIWGDSMVVVSNFLKDSIITRGTIVTAVNGRSNQQLLDSMYTLVSGDGYTNSFQQQVISFYFPNYYKSAFGVDSTFEITHIDSSGAEKKTVIKAFNPKLDSLEKKRLAALPKPSRKERKERLQNARRNLRIDTALNTAFMNVNTFSDSKLQRFFRRSFRTIRKNNVENLVLDLRENSGGNIFSSVRLIQYLADSSFRIADTMAAIDRSFKHRKHIKPWFLYWLSMHLSGRKMEDGKIHFRYFEKHRFKPKGRNHYDGNIYIVTGGYTFSAAAMVAGTLKGQKNVTLVGEETGGGYYGNSAVHLPIVTMPASKVRVVLPLYRLVVDKNREKNGRGVLPDVEVLPSSQAIRQGIDIKLQKVITLIKQKDEPGNGN